AAVVGQVQRPASEITDALRVLEPRLELGRGRRVGKPVVDGASGGEELEMPADGLRVVRERFAAREQDGCQEGEKRLHEKRPTLRKCSMSALTRRETGSMLCPSRTSARSAMPATT